MIFFLFYELEKLKKRYELQSEFVYLTETRIPWPFCQACICLTYRNEGIYQLKRRILWTIWGWEWSETGLSSCPYIILDFSCSCLMPSLIPPKEYGYRLDQRANLPINLSLQEKPEPVYWWHCLRSTQPPGCTGNNCLFLKIWKNQSYVPTPSRISWHWLRHTDRGSGTNPSKQIQILRLHHHQQEQTSCKSRYMNIKCF